MTDAITGSTLSRGMARALSNDEIALVAGGWSAAGMGAAAATGAMAGAIGSLATGGIAAAPAAVLGAAIGAISYNIQHMVED